MRCTECKRLVGSGVEARKMVVEYVQDDGTTKIFGLGLPAGPISGATGRLKRGFHSKCFWAAKKREARGDQGRTVAAVPVYSEPTQDLSARLAAMRAIASEIGLPIGDPNVTEAYQARQRGGPYPHEHHIGLDNYQLVAHLHYAHGLDFETIRHHGDIRSLHDVHHEPHGHDDPPPRDWRDQHTIDV